MLRITCEGSPYEIGQKHGRDARIPISRSIHFYAGLFQTTAKMQWDKVQALALEFEPVIRKKWPAYLEEMSGVAQAAGVALADIIAINVRTEINFGLFSDGCTALSWKTDSTSFLAQNWDWMEEQKENLVQLTILQSGKPTIKMITEAGLIGKIGLNSAGVGVCLNAIRAKGMDPTRLPCHLGLRMVLESQSRAEAVNRLEKYGIASSCHMLVADATGSVGLEWSAVDLRKLDMNPAKQVFHSNHYLLQHPGVEDPDWLEDSTFRVKRIEQLCERLREESSSNPDPSQIFELFKDEENFPGSICRSQQLPKTTSATLFNIVMDLETKRASVTLGRPMKPNESFVLGF